MAALMAADFTLNGLLMVSVSAMQRETACLFVVDPDGTNLRQLADIDVYSRWRWSPDSNKIAYQTSGGGMYGELFVVDSDGTNRRQLTETEEYPEFGNGFDWSPDGNYLMYAIGGTYSFALFIVESDGSNRRQIHESESDATAGYEWSYSPDGRQFVLYPLSYDSDRCEEPWARSAFLANADGTSLRPYSDSLDWSSPPDSTVIYIEHVEGADGQQIDVLFAENTDGTNRRQLSEMSHDLWPYRADACFTLSPDGNHVAYTAGYSDLFIVDSDGTNLRQLADNRSGSCPTWRPIGS